MANRARAQFECDGVAFDVGRLNLNDSCNGLELLAKVLGPAIGQLQENPAAALTALLGQASHIPKLLALFTPAAKVARNASGEYGIGEGFAFVDLKPFQDQVFTSRLDLACAFLAECVRLEYSAFLASATSGPLAKLVAKI
jgi:hypothetical protein